MVSAATLPERAASWHARTAVGALLQVPAYAASLRAQNCSSCHAGDSAAATQAAAHDGLIAFSGDLASADRACGSCHDGRVEGVAGNLMHTGHGIVRKTRAVIDGAAAAGDDKRQQHADPDENARRDGRPASA
jgi:hypothetical protein